MTRFTAYLRLPAPAISAIIDHMRTNAAHIAIQFLRSLLGNNDGQDMIEYALLVAAVAVIVAAILPPALMPAIDTVFSRIASTLSLA